MKTEIGLLRKLIYTTLALLLASSFSFHANAAQAHRLHVFAWLENDQIIVECNFGNKRPAIDAPVTIIDKDTNQTLVQGVTDKTGHYTFPVPSVIRDGHTLGIVVNTGDGHRSEWIMPASELYAASSLTAGFDQEAVDMEKQGIAPNSQQPQASGIVQIVPSTRQLPAQQQVKIPGPEHLRVIIRDEMEQQLAPLRKALAAKSAEGPSLNEIVGGIGWIVGIIGIVLFFLSRRKN